MATSKITKEYDEMTDITKYSTPYVRMGGNGYFAKRAKLLTQRYIALKAVVGIKDGNLTAYLAFAKRGDDWAWAGDTSTIFLVDGVRTQGEGSLVESFTSTYESTVFCNEVVSQKVELDYLKDIAKATSVKFRVGRLDIVPPEEFFPNLKELLETTKILGK
jgi:hypothetical protein